LRAVVSTVDKGHLRVAFFYIGEERRSLDAPFAQ